MEKERRNGGGGGGERRRPSVPLPSPPPRISSASIPHWERCMREELEKGEEGETIVDKSQRVFE